MKILEIIRVYKKSYKKNGLKITSENILIVCIGTTAVSKEKW